MKTMLALVLFAACSHSQPVTEPVTPAPEPTAAAPVTGTPVADSDEPSVDPTLPSWAPRSCSGYHAAVVRALACDAIESTKRDQIKAQYEVDHAKWDTMHDQPLDAVAKVGIACKSQRETVLAAYNGKCVTAQTP